MTQVWDNGPEDRTETMVLLALADRANDDGTSCYPSLTEISARCRLSRQGTVNVLDRLEDNGWLSRDRGGGEGNPTHYYINAERLRQSSSLTESDSQDSQADKVDSQADKDRQSSWLDGNRQGTVKEPSGGAPAHEVGEMFDVIVSVMREVGTLNQRLESRAYNLAKQLSGEYAPKIVRNALREDLDGSVRGWNGEVFKDSVLPEYVSSTTDTKPENAQEIRGNGQQVHTRPDDIRTEIR